MVLTSEGRTGDKRMIENSRTAWGWPAILLHWIGAVVILLLLGHGWWMTHLALGPDHNDVLRRMWFGFETA
jgi:cytochrome b561